VPIVHENKITGMRGIGIDITERKRAEEALRESEDRYRTLVELFPDAILIYQEGKFIFVNPASLKLFGASDRDEIIGKGILDFVHPDFLETVREAIQHDLEGKKIQPIEIPSIRLDGKQIIVEGRGVRTTINGKPALQVTLRDMTERNHAEEALRESEEKYRNLVNRANDAICVIQDGVIKMVNNRLMEF
jgi:PAS domain S-box-containing protein